MKIKIKLLVFGLLNFLLLEGQITFQKKIGTAGFEKPTAVQKVNNGYVIAGYNYSVSSNKEAWLLKTDPNGVVLWSKSFGGSRNEKINSFDRTSDNGFIFIGVSSSFKVATTDSLNSFLVKTDSNGVVQWTKIFGSNSNDVALKVKTTASGDYVFCGYTNGGSIGQQDMFLVKTDINGNLLWQTNWGTLGKDTACSLVETSAGDIVVVGHTDGQGTLTPSPGVIINVTKFNSNGTILWSKLYDDAFSYSVFNTNRHKYARDVSIDNTGNYILCGRMGSNIFGSSVPIAISIDSNGNINWSKSYTLNSGTNFANMISKTSNGFVLASGYTNGITDVTALIKIDFNGNQTWNNCYNTNSTSQEVFGGIFAIETFNNNEFLIGASNVLFSDSSLHLIKTNSTNGNSGCNNCSVFSTGFSNSPFTPTLSTVFSNTLTFSSFSVTLIQNAYPVSEILYCSTNPVNISENLNENKDVSIYPNPMLNEATVELKLLNQSFYNFNLCNLYGDIVLTKQINNTNTFKIYKNNLVEGIYFYKIISNDGHILTCGKLIIGR